MLQAPEGPATVLAVDDDAGDALILRRELEAVGDLPGGAERNSALPVEFVHCVDAAAARRELARRRVDLVFLDYRLGADTGMEVLEDMRSSGYLGPIIVLTGHGDEYLAASLIRAGADDYIVKNDLNPRVLRRAIDNAESRYWRRTCQARNKQLLAELQAAKKSLEEKNQRLSELYHTAHEFVDNVSHEFRTPLTVIKEFASIIRDGLAGQVGDQQREYLDIIINRVDDLGIMVDDMLDISKLEAGVLGICRRKCRTVDIIEHVRTTLERRAHARAVALDISVDQDLPLVYCDPEKIGRVIINLAVNAFKFSNEGGHVNLWARQEADQSAVVIGVTDDGPGISPDNLQIIFQRFKQVQGSIRASTRGFGLGLSIARELVQLNFGDISVESKPGRGSTFSFTIPSAWPRHLLTRYLERIEGIRQGSNFVSLLGAGVGSAVNPERLDETEQFLQQQMRRSDLIFRVEQNRWLLVAATGRQGPAAMVRRIEGAWSQACKSRPDQPPPAVKLEVMGTWPVSTQSADFINRFETELREPELCGASLEDLSTDG